MHMYIITVLSSLLKPAHKNTMFLHTGCKSASSSHIIVPSICMSLSDGLNSYMPIKSVMNCKKTKDEKNSASFDLILKLVNAASKVYIDIFGMRSQETV